MYIDCGVERKHGAGASTGRAFITFDCFWVEKKGIFTWRKLHFEGRIFHVFSFRTRWTK